MNRSVLTLTKTLIAALAVAGAPLAAQDATLRLGGQLSFASPIGNLADIASTGFGVSVFGELPMSMDTAIRGRVDYIIFGSKKMGVFKINSEVKDLVIAADGIYSPFGHDNGIYLLVTAGIQRMSWELSRNSASDTGLCYGVGAGYNVNRYLGAEAKFIKGPSIMSGDVGTGQIDSFSNNYIQISACFRF